MEYVGFSMLLAFIMLDRKHAFQFAISQPLISCTLIGLVTNNMVPAMYFGLLVQLVWLGNLPIGASTTPEGTMASVIGCVLYVHFENDFTAAGHFILFAIFAYTIAMSFVGGKIENFQRTFNIGILNCAVDSIKDDKKANLGKFILGALTLQYLFNFIFLIVGINMGLRLFYLLDKEIFIRWASVFQFIDLAIIGTGVGMVLTVYKSMQLKKIIAAVSVIGLLIFKII